MIIPGILENDFEEIEKKIGLVEDVSERIQIDIADGELVNGRTFSDVEQIGNLKTTAELELHLMVENPLEFVETKISNVGRVCAQIEAILYVEDFVKKAHEKVYVVGLSLAPESELNELEHYIDHIDFVQFMTVIPGEQGRLFEGSVLEKIKEFKTLWPNMPCQADGGINEHTINKAIEVGCKNVVVGSAIFNSDKPIENIKSLNNMIGEVESKHD